MGDTVSTLVFRPPIPTRIKPSKFFYIDVPVDDESSCMSEGCNMVPSTSHFESDMTLMGPHKIPAFFIRRRGATLTFLFSHGNAEDLGMMYGRMKEMARVLGVNVLAYDYTGYGLSSGLPSEEMCYRNIEAAYNYLRNERKIPSSHIVLYGRSLGSGPSCHLAKITADKGESVAGLILHSPFLSIYRIVMDLGFNLVGDMFRNKDRARDIKCPVLIIHGTKDDVVPFWHGDELLRSFPPQCRAEPFFVNGLGHNSIELYAKIEYSRRIISFLNNYVLANEKILKRNINEVHFVAKYEPMAVPENERYHPEKSLTQSGKVFVNRTWMQHGTEIINEAVNSKKVYKNVSRRTVTPDKTSKINSSLANSMKPTMAIERSTSEILAQINKEGKCENPAMDNDDISYASRFITTRDSQLEDEDSGDDDVEIEWKRQSRYQSESLYQ